MKDFQRYSRLLICRGKKKERLLRQILELGGKKNFIAGMVMGRRRYEGCGESTEVLLRKMKEAVPLGTESVSYTHLLLLTGSKATGKNVLAENLAWIFGRPSYNISFHVNTGSAELIGTDTFVDNQVQLRKGSIYQCAQYGGFGILDEINMAKNDAVSVLHATLDYRRSIDVPGYDKIDLHPAARFIGTMNYGYAGTKELNEACLLYTSRCV